MNRIILIGNGFDLAHGLNTRYTDFIDDYWKRMCNESEMKFPNTFKNEELEFIQTGIDSFTVYEDYETIKQLLKAYPNSKLTFKNKFLEQISNKLSLKNWVDIEEEYYSELKEKSKLNTNNHFVLSLNEHFEGIKELLVKYLIKENKKNSSPRTKINDCIQSPFLIKNLNSNGVDNLVDLAFFNKEYTPNTDDRRKIKRHNPNWREQIDDKLINPQEVLFLNFNYTDTEKIYTKISEKVECQSIHIHGELNNELNPIIFGYGDELDDDYKTIEKLNDNRFLDYIKSIEYLKTDNYKRLLSFVESDCYQIFIMGHSCGLSDRTLLNTLFEHDNCVSIKPFFYKKEDGTDNYIELVQNISRNFNDKVKMRDRVVNKTDCTTLT